MNRENDRDYFKTQLYIYIYALHSRARGNNIFFVFSLFRISYTLMYDAYTYSFFVTKHFCGSRVRIIYVQHVCVCVAYANPKGFPEPLLWTDRLLNRINTNTAAKLNPVPPQFSSFKLYFRLTRSICVCVCVCIYTHESSVLLYSILKTSEYTQNQNHRQQANFIKINITKFLRTYVVFGYTTVL